jgi:hypothetical protein
MMTDEGSGREILERSKGEEVDAKHPGG